jgi:hypothetical protein
MGRATDLLGKPASGPAGSQNELNRRAQTPPRRSASNIGLVNCRRNNYRQTPRKAHEGLRDQRALFRMQVRVLERHWKPPVSRVVMPAIDRYNILLY